MSGRRTAVFQYFISSSKGLLFASTLSGVLLCLSITGCLRGVMEQSGTSTAPSISAAPPASTSAGSGTSPQIASGVSFKIAGTIPITYVGNIVAADFNGDGKDDLLVSYVLGSKLVLFLNKGDGSFAAPIYLTPNADAAFVGQRMSVVDFNRDGKLDVLVPWSKGDGATGGLSLMLGNGDGTFQPGQSLAGVPAGAAIATGDFNRDGIFDVAVTGGFGPLSIWLGSKDNSFVNAGYFTDRVFRLAIGDFNKDGIPDIAFTYQLSNSISVLLGKGDGTFEKKDLALNPSLGATPQFIALADLNKDGNLDILTGNSNSKENFSLWLGNGDGTFQQVKNFELNELSDFGFPLLIADINGDGITDIVVPDSLQIPTRSFSSLSVLLGNGDGSFQAQKTFDELPLGAISALGDFNGDHKPDIATLTKDGIAILINTTR